MKLAILLFMFNTQNFKIMVKLNFITREQALQMVCLIKVNYDDKDWVIFGDFCRIYVYDDSFVSRREFTKMVKRQMGIDLEWQSFQLSISWKGGAE